MMLRVFGIVDESIVDGPGFRVAVFAQGCEHDCPGCHNPESHAMDGGKLVDIADIVEKVESNPLIDGITLTGGEPFLQSEAMAELAKSAGALGKSVWVYSGYTFEELMSMAGEGEPGVLELLKSTDVLIDGRFVLGERTLERPFVGSANQRILDVRESLAKGRAVDAAI